MFGIRGLDPFGLVHAFIGIAALGTGLLVIVQPKGSAFHRVWGTVYVVAMVLLNASALAIYDLSGRFNVFHALAIVSLATLGAGWMPALTRRPADAWYERHANCMAWSYVGLVAAFAAEVAARIPALRGERLFVAAVAGATLLVTGTGAFLIRRYTPRAVSRFTGSGRGRVRRSLQDGRVRRASIGRES